MKTVVIVGGGFAGVYAAKNLLKNTKVVMISSTNYFLFSPLLHEVAVGSVNRHNIVEPIRDILTHKNFRFYRAEAKKIDAKNKQVYFNSTKISYDYLIIAIGSKTFYRVPGAEQHAISLKTIRDSIEIRDRIISVLESANLSKTEKELKKYLTFVIVGGGPSGVELAGDICDLVQEDLRHRYPHLKNRSPRIYLLQADKDIVPIMHEKGREYARKTLERKGIEVITGCFVERVEKESVKIKDKRIEAGTIIWAGGVIPNEVETSPRLQDEKGYFVVDGYLRVKGYDDIFSLGDCSYIEESPVPGLAQVAVKQAEAAAKNIIYSIRGSKLKKFKFHNNGVLVSLGKRTAVGEIYLPGGKTIIIKGMAAWFLKRHIYFMNIVGLQNKIRVGIEWFLNLIFPRDTSEI